MKICSVVVTYNRIKDLKKCIQCYESQIENLDCIIIVNNNSTDGTREFLEEWSIKEEKYSKEVINLNQNVGGSGGFFEGISLANEMGYDWIWLHDDDAYLKPNTIKLLKEKLNAINEKEVSAICANVIDNGKPSFQHRRRIKIHGVKVEFELPQINEYRNEFFEINTFSYVGIAINSKKLKLAGLTNRDFFIYFDDTEHGYRLSKYGKILCYPQIEIIHNQENNNEEFSWKTYYGIRNMLYFIKINFGIKKYFYHSLREMKNVVFKPIEYKKIVIAAIKDSFNNKLGLHNVYQPGWKVNKIMMQK